MSGYSEDHSKHKRWQCNIPLCSAETSNGQNKKCVSGQNKKCVPDLAPKCLCWMKNNNNNDTTRHTYGPRRWKFGAQFLDERTETTVVRAVRSGHRAYSGGLLTSVVGDGSSTHVTLPKHVERHGPWRVDGVGGQIGEGKKLTSSSLGWRVRERERVREGGVFFLLILGKRFRRSE